MQDILRRIEAWLAEQAPDFLAQLPPGATDEEIARTEAALSITFPDDVKAFYSWHNGSPGLSMMGEWEFLPLDSVLGEWEIWEELLNGGEFKNNVTQPDQAVKGGWWNPCWVPIMTDGGGDCYCLDFDPAPEGAMGQVIIHWHDRKERPRVATSFREWLEQYADDLEAGLYLYSEEMETIHREDDPNY